MVLRHVPLFCHCSICIVAWMGPKECVCSIRCLAKFEFWLFVLNAALCSLNLAQKFLLVCPTYALLQSGQVSLYTPDCVYLSVLFVNCLLCMEYFLDGVIGTHCYFQIGVFEQVGDTGRLFAYVGERGPFLCRCGFQFVAGGDFL